ncbi:MAG: M28 family peptidase [candidate division Zixibacteria bacterium]|nr:M28 family peptidase [candidate division Zixibacteria bacterium]
MMRRVASGLLLAAAAVLFFAVAVPGPQWVTDKVILRFVSMPTGRSQPVSAVAPARPEEIAEIIAETSLAAHVDTLSSLGSRVAGYPGNRVAMQYISDAFHRIGMERIAVDTFSVLSPIDHGFTLTAGDSTTFPIYQFWPNLIRLDSFPEGVTGTLLYGGKGAFSAFNGHDVEGSIVLCNFDSRDEFLNARMLGAQAIVFFNNAPGAVSNNQASRKILDVPASVPRFYVEDEQAQQLLALAKAGNTRVTIRGRMAWEKTDTWNILGWLPGADEPIPGDPAGLRWKDRIVVLSAHYDAMSVVPARAPGAEMAGGIAGLLEIARTLRIFPPKYSVVFLANSAHHNGLQGVNEFLDGHWRANPFFLDRIDPADRIPFTLFLGLDLSSQTDQVGLFCYGSFFNAGPNLKNLFAPYAKRYIEYARSAGLYDENESQSAYLNTLLPSTRTQFSYMPALQAFDSEIVTLSGLHGMTFASPNDNRVLADTPLDLPEFVNISNLTHQTRTIAGLLTAMLSDPAAFVVDESIKLRDEGRDLEGRVLEFDRTVDFFRPNTPVPDAIVVYPAGFQSHAGVRGFMVTQADSTGHFRMSMIRDPLRPVKLRSYGLDASGDIVYAPDLGEEGNKTFPLDVPNAAHVNRTIQVLFPCQDINLFDIVDPGAFVALDHLTVLGADNSVLRKYGAAVIENQRLFGNWMTNAAVVFARPEDCPKMFMSTGPLGIKYLLTNADEAWLDRSPDDIRDPDAARGDGFDPAQHSVIKHPFFRSAVDLWVLNDTRLADLERHGVLSARAASLHTLSTEALRDARKARDARRYDVFVAKSREAWGYEARAYPDVRYAADDTVDGIVFYFMLLLPFCFFVERLFFGSPDIRKQLATSGIIFVAVFILLHRVHPAFQLSLTPYIVFLAFIILALGLLIIALLVGRFDSEMKNLNRSTTGLHEADIGRLSATAVAVSLGISNLRKRKLRTALTAITLTLLTFTVLSFTSFKTGIQFYTLNRDNTPPYQGMLLRSLSWNSLPTSFLPYVHNAFGDKAQVVPRSWYQAEDLESPFIDLHVPEKNVASNVQILLGLHADEPEVTQIDRFLLPGGRWFLPDERMACLLPTEMAERLDITPADVGKTTVELLGTRYTVVGLLDSKRLDAFRDMDDESILPANFTMTQTVSQTAEEDFFMSTMKAAEHVLSRNTLILPYQQTLDLSGSTRSVAVSGFADEQTLSTAVEAFMSRVLLAMFVGSGDNVKVYSSIGTTSISGVSNLIIPILIAAFLVLNTMMGAVHERFREIGVYSAVGLAPNHVAALFLAEAGVFATLGAVLGYLIGQLLTIGLSYFDLLGAMSLNYSSLSAVYATLVVMVVVFLSTVYPAKKAADMTVEDVTRRWKPPAPEGDRWTFEFPFTVSAIEAPGLSAYLTHIFRSHEDSSAEDFVAENSRMADTGGGAYEVRTTTWLAPYDLAISQEVALRLEPSPDDGIYRILIDLYRLSGDGAQWQTINRRFFGVLRKRFLVWRTLQQELKMSYRQTGMTGG